MVYLLSTVCISVVVVIVYLSYHVPKKTSCFHHPETCPVKQDRKFSLLPQKVRLDPSLRVVSITSGPLAHHSFLLLQRNAVPTPTANGYPMSNGHQQHPSEGGTLVVGGFRCEPWEF